MTRVCRCLHASVVILLLFLTGSVLADGVSGEPCIFLNRSVSIPVQVRLLFAGTPPVFMREKTWNSRTKAYFLKSLSNTLRFPAVPTEDDRLPLAPVLGRRTSNSCSVIEYDYKYESEFSSKNLVQDLDNALAEIIKNSSSMFVDSTLVADRFYNILSAKGFCKRNKDPTAYNVLIYNAMSVAPQYGFRAEEGSAVGTIGISSEERFAFVDVGARPFFLSNSDTLTPGELLMSLSQSPLKYATEMHSIIANILTPPVSKRMRRFPQETRLAFQLNLVDVSAVIGRKPGVGGDSLGNKPLGSTFISKNFTDLLYSVFSDSVVKEKQLSVSITAMNMTEDSTMAMAVARSFSMKGLDMALDSNRLLKDVLINNSTGKYGFFADSSFVAHIPMYLFSFADDSRITHFDSGEEIRAKVMGKQAVFMVENRLRDNKDDFTSVTSEAAKEVLELLLGLSSSSLSLMNSRIGRVPVLLRDISRRNLLAQELDWSEAIAAWKASELLNYEGLDSRLIPHDSGSAIAQTQKVVKQNLRKLQESWRQAANSLSVRGVETATLELMEKSRRFADKLHEEICNQPLPEEILLKAEMDFGAHRERRIALKRKPSYLLWLGLPAIAGILCGTVLHYRSGRRAKVRSAYLDDLSMPATMRGFEETTSQWFSTLTAGDKRKVN